MLKGFFYHCRRFCTIIAALAEVVACVYYSPYLAIQFRLLIDHTHTHSYLLNKEQPPNCNYCKSSLTVEHILTSCSAYKNIREKHYSNSRLPHILTNISKQHIFNYLSEINIFNKLLFSLWHDVAYLC